MTPIVRGKARFNVEFEAKISISATGDGLTFLDCLSFNPYNDGEDLRNQALAYRRRLGCYPEEICAVRSITPDQTVDFVRVIHFV